MPPKETVFVVDDDADARHSLSVLLASAGYGTETFRSAREFLASDRARQKGLVIADVRMPDMDGLELQEALKTAGSPLTVIIVTGHADVPLAVRAMKAGASDFLEKPFDEDTLLASVERACQAASRAPSPGREEGEKRLASLTERERQVLELIVEGRANKVIAYELSISPRTVELHRARVMDKMKVRNLAELVRVALPLLGLR